MSSRPPLEVADVFRCPEVKRKVSPCCTAQQRVIRAVTACRTAILGGHKETCDQCGHSQISYNSCRNRHCPKCEASANAEWVSAQELHLLPVPYAHVVFTLPRSLAPLVLQNHRMMYGLLFRAASEALLELGRDPAHLGARIGCLAILHTWGQTLQLHPHLHCLLPAGGLSPDGSRWIASRGRFFLPVRVLSRLFRGKFLALLGQAHAEKRLSLQGDLSRYSDRCAYRSFARELRGTEWVVYARPPVRGASHILKYLARYTHRIAISNSRLRRLENGRLSFTWKDYAHGGRERIMTLDATEFARRFLLHVLPDRFVRIRYYGFLANACRAQELARCRAVLRSEQEPVDEACTQADAITEPVRDARTCPACQEGQLLTIEIIPPDSS